MRELMNGTPIVGRGQLRRSLAGAFLLLLVSTLAYSPPQAMAAESTADLTVWQVVNEKRKYTGTAFAIGKRHFITSAHVIEDFIKQDSKQLVLTQRGNATELTVNYNYVAMSMTYDLAVFSTREEVEHVLRFASPSSGIRRTGLRIIGYPEGRFAVTQQAEGTIYEDALSYSVPLDRPIVGGFSGSPMLDDDDRVVGVFHSAAGNMADVVKLRHVHDFLDGKLQWTACRDHPSQKRCRKASIAATERAAEAGDVLAQFQLGAEKDLPGHADWLTRAAERGFADAQDRLGDHYRERKDWRRTAYWCRRAAEQGHPLAMVGPAARYRNGEGVARDPARAFRLMRESAIVGYTVAQYNLGVMHLRGIGTPVDRELARHWLEKALAKGDEDARSLLDKMESQSGSTTEGASEPATVIRAAKRSNVRAGPGTSYAKVDLLEVGQAVRVIERIGDWFRLEPQPGQTERYVYAPLLSGTRPGA